MLLRIRTLGWVVIALGLPLACSSGEGDPSEPTCPQGAKGCACYGNQSCDAGLKCSGNSCVADSGSGGSGGGTGAVAGSGTNGGTMSTGGSGGANASGDGGTSAGTATTGGGGATGGGGSGGASATGGGGAGGSTAGTGGASCGDTMSDVKNCGTCGHECRTGDAGSCKDGQCVASLVGCFGKPEFNTCDAYCSSIGETCVAKGCFDFTYVTAIDLNACQAGGFVWQHTDTGGCGDTVADQTIQCCCTDTK